MNVNSNIWEDMPFESKEVIVIEIKQFHYNHGFHYVVQEFKVDRYVSRYIHFGNGCQWWIKTSFSKILK